MSRTPFSISARWVTAFLIVSIGIGYSLFTRSAETHFRNWILANLFVSTPLCVAYCYLACVLKMQPRVLLRLLATTLVVPFYTLSLYSLGELALDVTSWLQQPDLNRPVSFVVVAAGVCIAGLSLFYVRLHLRFIYGLTEMLAGVAVSTLKIFTEIPQYGEVSATWSLAFLTAGVYLVVRGLDNMHQGLTKEPLDAGLLWISKYLPGTSRRYTWLSYLKILKSMRNENVVSGKTFNRQCMKYSDPETKTTRAVYQGKKIEEAKETSFIAIDDNTLIFHLNPEARKKAYAIDGAHAWRPHSERSTLNEWVVIPFESRHMWPHLAVEALAGIKEKVDK